ncbi:hypothetical protein Tco_0647333, partial [Tanacetum coccineum]
MAAVVIGVAVAATLAVLAVLAVLFGG